MLSIGKTSVPRPLPAVWLRAIVSGLWASALPPVGAVTSLAGGDVLLSGSWWDFPLCLRRRPRHRSRCCAEGLGDWCPHSVPAQRRPGTEGARHGRGAAGSEDAGLRPAAAGARGLGLGVCAAASSSARWCSGGIGTWLLQTPPSSCWCCVPIPLHLGSRALLGTQGRLGASPASETWRPCREPCTGSLPGSAISLPVVQAIRFLMKVKHSPLKDICRGLG